MMDYTVAGLVIAVSAVLTLSCGDTNAQTDAFECFTPVTLVSMSNDK